MASGDGGDVPGLKPEKGESIPLGKPMSAEQHMLDKGADMMQSLKPVNQMDQHVCTFAMYAHDLTRQIETHHFITRANQDFLQCPVYDTDDRNARLIGVENVISPRIFETLPPEEQKLWHSHAYEIKSALWVNPRVPEMVMNTELENLSYTYGKFWCTWQVDRGDRLPLGPPALMMSPQPGIVRPDLIERRDLQYNISTEALRSSRLDITGPERINQLADYWKHHGKCFAIHVEPTEMKKRGQFP